MRQLWLAVFVTACSTSSGSTLVAHDCDHVYDNTTACCRNENDCVAAGQANYQCTPDGTPEPFGACPMANCDVDADCRASGGTQICQDLACALPGSTQTGWCVGGCTSDLSCTEGNSCDLATNRCHATTCTADTDCPVDFTCSGTCTRKTCTSDHECSGYCVLGQCYQAAGECRGPVA